MNSPPWEGDDWVPPEDEWAEECAAAPAAPAALTKFAAELLLTNTRAAAHWRGNGKANGDTSPRGYDWATARHVLSAGGTDEDAISAVITRPDGHARELGLAYARSTVNRARGEDKPEKQAAPPVSIDRVVIYASRPPSYELHLGAVSVNVSMAVLLSRPRLKITLAEALSAIPELPPTKGGAFEGWVNGLLATAETVEMPEDASTEAGMRNDVGHLIDGLPGGETAEEFERGAVLTDDHGRRLLSMPRLFATVQAAARDVTRPMLGRFLRELEWVPATVYLEGKQLRAWRSK
jgi:hypothetical protein